MRGKKRGVKCIWAENIRLKAENRRLSEQDRLVRSEIVMQILDYLPGWVSVHDLEYNIIGLNTKVVDAFCRSGFSAKQDFIGQKCFAVYKGRETPCPECAVSKMINTNETIAVRRATNCEQLISDIFTDIYFIPLRDGHGKVFAVVEMAVQNSRRLECNAKHDISNSFLQILLDAIPSPVYYKDDQGRYLGFNTAFERWAGVPRNKIMFNRAEDVFPKNLVDPIREKEEIVRKTQGACVFEVRTDLKDGSHRHYLHTKAAYPTSETGQGIIGVVTDVTEIRHARDALMKQKEYYERLLDEANIWIDAIDPEGNIILWNKKAEELSGYKRKELLGNKIKWQLIYPDPDVREYLLAECLKLIRNGQVIKDYETEVTTLSGKKIISWSSNLIRNDLGEVMGCMFLGVDVTERKHMEKELMRLDRLNLAGEIAASIAHEIRNPMTTVRGFLQLMAKKADIPQKTGTFDLMIEELDRANAIITEFLATAKNKAVELKLANLNTVIRNVLPLIQAEALMSGRQVKVELKTVPDLLIDEKEIRQLLMNLCKNGLEATGPGGTVVIKTRVCGGDVVLAVQDDGCGIPKDLLDKLGTPFLTTKESGTGLGLAVCYSIVGRHNAGISVETGEQGTTFYIKFKTEDNKAVV